MAIARIKKVEIIGLKSDEERLLSFLQKRGVVQMTDIRPAEHPAAKTQLLTETGRLAELEEVIAFLGAFAEKTGFLESIVTIRQPVYHTQFAEILRGFNYQEAVTQIGQLRAELKDLVHAQEKVRQEEALLTPWRGMRLAAAERAPTVSCEVALGTLGLKEYAACLEELEGEKARVYVDRVSQDAASVYLALVYLKADRDRLLAVLKARQFHPVNFSLQTQLVAERLRELAQREKEIEVRIGQIKEKLGLLARQRFELMVMHDHLGNVAGLHSASQSCAHQHYTFYLCGWIKTRDAAIFEAEKQGAFANASVFLSDPSPEDNVPVALENPVLIQPFEFITQIFGMPQYHELDPTPYLAFFFFLYFGLCVSDTGYGVILLLVSWYALKKYPMGPQGKKFFRLFFYCGISTILIGVATGSWFGNLFDILSQQRAFFLPLKKFKDALILLDPMQEPTKFLGIALSLGIVQVWFGNIVAGIGNIKNRRYADVFMDQLPMLTLLFGLTGIGLVTLQITDAAGAGIFQAAALAGSIGLVLTQGRSEKGIGSKAFYGLFNLYNALSGYLSDILSYSRLWALGLVTGAMASTINLIAVQFAELLTAFFPASGAGQAARLIFGTLVFCTVFILGHAVSFVMNLLGAFVHPVRLQFVEFFSKFFKPGGSAFRPFRLEAKYVNLN